MLTVQNSTTTRLKPIACTQVMGAARNKKRNIKDILAYRCPTLMQQVRSLIEASEFKYCGGWRNESFLWQHTVYVASMAMTLSYQEDIDPFYPVVTALFHDCGKFENGKYHANNTPEEQTGARIARDLMQASGFSRSEIGLVQDSLLALYNEKRAGNINTRIVNDADSLVKFGHMGFGNFFEKSVLRGMVIRNSILRVMSKELTYAASLETKMATRSGKKMARKKAGISISLFRNYLEELRTTGISDYEIREMAVNLGNGNRVPLILVLPRYCEHCWNPLSVEFDREKGIKRERLVVRINCPVCSHNPGYDFSFCLPELGARESFFMECVSRSH